jgi:hypothetical protein
MTTNTVGSTAFTQSALAGYVLVMKITASASGSLTSVGLNIQGAAGNLRVAIYSTDGSTISGLLGQSSSVAMVNGWNDLPITGVTITASTVYYIAFQVDSASANIYQNQGGPETRYYATATYGSFPDPTGSVTGDTARNYNMRMIYAPGSTSINVSDSGAGVEVPSSQVTFGIGDSGVGADSPTEKMDFLDNAIGGENPIVPWLQVSDSGVGSETEASTVTFSVGDAGSGADNPIEWMNYSDKSNRQHIEGTSVAVSDSGIGIESYTLDVTMNLSDSGAGAESTVFQTSFTVADFGSGIESTPQISFTLTESGAGLDGFTSTATLPLSDSGAGADAISWQAQVPTADSGAGVDLTVASVTFTVQDAGSGVEAMPVISLNLLEVGSGGDVRDISARFTATDLGAGLEVFSKQFTASDAGLGGDRFAIRVLRSGRLQYTVRLRVTENVFDPAAFDPYSFE